MKVAILLPTWVGDTCMATPTLRAIRHGIPEIKEMCLVGRYAPVSILEGCPWAESSIIYKPKSKGGALSRRQLISRLRQERFDWIVLLPNSLSAGLIGFFSGAKRRIGYAKDGRSWLLTERIPVRTSTVDATKLPTIDYYLRIASHLGCSTDNRQMELWTSDADVSMAKDMYRTFGFDWDRPTVVFNTSSATAVARLWPDAQASRAARELAEQGLQVVLHAGPTDRDRANELELQADHHRVKSMGQIAEIPMGLSRAAIARAAVVVSTDSGPRHIAVALNRPVVGLFGPTGPAGTRTYNYPELPVQNHLDCMPCGKAVCPLAHNECMQGLNSQRVVEAVLERLRKAEVGVASANDIQLSGRVAG